MTSTTTRSDPASSPHSPSTRLKSLDRRITSLCIKIATDRADAREKIIVAPGTWVKDNQYTRSLEVVQINVEKDWIELREEILEAKEWYVCAMEREYEALMAEWRAEGKV